MLMRKRYRLGVVLKYCGHVPRRARLDLGEHINGLRAWGLYNLAQIYDDDA